MEGGDTLNQQHLCMMFSSRYEGVNKLEISPFLAVMRTVKLEYSQNHPEIYKMLLAVLHDYNPNLGQAHLHMTSRYISLLLERHPEFAEYIISVLPPPPDGSTQATPTSLHLMRDDVRPAQNATSAGQGDCKVQRETTVVLQQSEEDESQSAVKRMRLKDGSIKFYNYTPPSVNAYVASQGIPQKIISNKSQSVGVPNVVSLTSANQVGSITSMIPATVVMTSSSGVAVNTRGTVLLRPPSRVDGGPRVTAPSRVQSAHGHTARLLSASCPKPIAPNSTLVPPEKTNNKDQMPTVDTREELNKVREVFLKNAHASSTGRQRLFNDRQAMSKHHLKSVGGNRLDRSTTSFPYSQHIIFNARAKIKHTVGSTEKGISVSRLPNPAAFYQVQKTTSQQISTEAKIDRKTAGPSLNSNHPFPYPGVKPLNEATTYINSKQGPTPGSTNRNNLPTGGSNLKAEALDLSTATSRPNMFEESVTGGSRSWEGGVVEDLSYSETTSQDDCDSQGTDGESTATTSQAPTTTDDASSDDPDTCTSSRDETFLSQILKPLSPPDYASSQNSEGFKEKRKSKTRYYSGKRKKPVNQPKI